MDEYEEKNATYTEFFREKNRFENLHETVFVGDSLTARCDLDKYYGFGINRGISGDAFKWVFRRLDVSVYDLDPDLVVFMMGVNDLNFYRATADDVVGYYERLMLDFTEKLSAPALFLSLCPVIEGAGSFVVAPGLNAVIDDVNARLEKLCDRFGYDYLNVHNLLTDEKNELRFEYALDNVHLSDDGYKVLTSAVKAKILSIKDRKKRAGK
ncbi:MAG: hypothetical protein IJ735_04120 [Clostridia bacterium]|nr:hypothetical protein [Clostridia bacterium]